MKKVKPSKWAMERASDLTYDIAKLYGSTYSGSPAYVRTIIAQSLDLAAEEAREEERRACAVIVEDSDNYWLGEEIRSRSKGAKG